MSQKNQIGNQVNNQSGIKSKYKTKTAVLIIAFLIVFFGSFMLGQYPIMPDELIKILLSKIFDIQQTWPDAA